MNRSIKSGIFGLVSFLPLASTSAFAAYGFGGDSKYGFGVEYEKVQRMDLSSFEHVYSDGTNDTQAGNFSVQRTTAALSYRVPGGVRMSLLGGVGINGTLSANKSVSGFNLGQSWVFNSSVSYGAALEWDPIQESVFHLRPRMRFLRTGYKGNRGSVATSLAGSCNYDFSSGATVSGVCATLGSQLLNPGSVYTISSNFQENDLSAGLEIALDFGGDGRGGTPALSVIAGGEVGVVSVSGTTVLTQTGQTTPDSTENVQFDLRRKQGAYAGIELGLAQGFLIGAKVRVFDQQTVSSTVEYRF